MMVKRRTLLAATLGTSLFTACKGDMHQGTEMPQPSTKSVGIWIDQGGTAIPVASADFVENVSVKGLYFIPGPIAAKLPSGLRVEVSCERISTGHFHLGISHNDRLHCMGKYAGAFDVRVFPEGHSSYVVSVNWSA
jgi:hypothetical protein